MLYLLNTEFRNSGFIVGCLATILVCISYPNWLGVLAIQHTTDGLNKATAVCCAKLSINNRLALICISTASALSEVDEIKSIKFDGNVSVEQGAKSANNELF
jgi:hypothetical protein